SEFRGFAFEGAAMALAILDLLVPWGPRRLHRFAAGTGARYAYMVHVGAGWALARLRRDPSPYLGGLDPLLGQLALDGYGFHEAHFQPHAAIPQQLQPARFTHAQRGVFDQGVGRSLWFVEGARVGAIATTIATFPS